MNTMTNLHKQHIEVAARETRKFGMRDKIGYLFGDLETISFSYL